MGNEVMFFFPEAMAEDFPFKCFAVGSRGA